MCSLVTKVKHFDRQVCKSVEQACKKLSKKASRCMTAAKPAPSRPEEGKQCIVQKQRIIMNVRGKKAFECKCQRSNLHTKCKLQKTLQTRVAIPAQSERPRLKAVMGKQNSEADRQGIGQAEACSGNGAGYVKGCCAPQHWQTQKEDCKGDSPHCIRQSGL